MNINQLEYLLDISRTYSISNTAKRFFMTQQAMSSSIRQLEKELGYVLLKRNNKGILFTDEGKIFLTYAEKMLNDFAELKSHLDITANQENDDAKKFIYIYNSSVIGYLINGNLLSIARKNFPNTKVRLFFNENNSYNLIEKPLGKNCDICIITMNSVALNARQSFFEEKNLVCDVLARDFIVGCFNSLSKYASLDIPFSNVNVNENTDQCVLHLSELEKYQDLFFENNAISIIRFDDILSVRDLLKKNTGLVTFMPNTTYKNYFSTSKYFAREIPDIVLTHALLYNKDCDEATMQFVNIIKEEVAKIL